MWQPIGLRVCLTTAVIVLSFLPLVAQSASFAHPWDDTRIAIVLDPYEQNDINWSKLSTDNRVVGIIHRATTGKRRDTRYQQRKLIALARGYKWGSYHLGRPGNPVEQADFYLDVTKPAANELMALDIEDLNPQHSMKLEDAVRFLERVKERTGRYPALYGDHDVVKEISRRFGKNGVYCKTKLWYARFKKDVLDFPAGTWESYTLWQFKSEVNCGQHVVCPYSVPGTGTDMDINVFSGTVEQAKAEWPFDNR